MSAPITIEIKNPSPSAALRLSFQDRVKPEEVNGDAPAPANVRNFTQAVSTDLRERMGAFGSELVPLAIRGTNLVSQVPRWQAEDAASLPHWVAQRLARRDTVTTAPPAPKGVRYIDSWEEARQADGIAAHGKALVQLTDTRRLVVECGEEITLSVFNPSGTSALRLRQMNKKTGETTNVSILQRGSQDTASVTITPKLAAVIEAMPS